MLCALCACSQEYAHVFPFLFTVQLICELGDDKLENYAFFRYRYSFEIFSAALLFLGGPITVPLQAYPAEYSVTIP